MFNDVHRDGVSKALITLGVAHSFRPAIGEALEPFAFRWCKTTYLCICRESVLLHPRIERLRDITHSTTPSCRVWNGEVYRLADRGFGVSLFCSFRNLYKRLPQPTLHGV